MDEQQFERFMKANQDSSSALVSAVNQFSTSAAANRVSSAQSMSKLASAVARGGDAPRSRDQFAKGDTISTILKVEKDCHNWAKATPFEPTKHSAELWSMELIENLVTTNAKDVAQWAGYQSYIRQSNDIFDFSQKIDQIIIDVGPLTGTDASTSTGKTQEGQEHPEGQEHRRGRST